MNPKLPDRETSQLKDVVKKRIESINRDLNRILPVDNINEYLDINDVDKRMESALLLFSGRSYGFYLSLEKNEEYISVNLQPEEGLIEPRAIVRHIVGTGRNDGLEIVLQTTNPSTQEALNYDFGRVRSRYGAYNMGTEFINAHGHVEILRSKSYSELREEVKFAVDIVDEAVNKIYLDEITPLRTRLGATGLILSEIRR